MQIVPLTIDMLEFRLNEEPEIEREWFVAHMRTYLAYDPGGCFALVDGGQPVGMVTAVCYQTVGWLGWLYVAEDRRGKGLGEQLMRRGMGYCIARGMRSILLEGVMEAIPLYRRIGFKEQFYTQHYRLDKDSFRGMPIPAAESCAVRPFAAEDLSAVAEFDQRFFHQDRAGMIGLRATARNAAGWAVRRGNMVVGHMGLTEAETNLQVGPIIVDPGAGSTVAIAAMMIREAFARYDKPMVIRCPLVVPDRAKSMQALGARPFDYRTMRMYAGEAYPAEGEGILCLGCPGKG